MPTIELKLPAKAVEFLQNLADGEGVPLDKYVHDMLEEHLDEEDHQVKMREAWREAKRRMREEKANGRASVTNADLMKEFDKVVDERGLTREYDEEGNLKE